MVEITQPDKGDKPAEQPKADKPKAIRIAAENENVIVDISEDGAVVVTFRQEFIESHYIMGGGIKRQVFTFKAGSHVDAMAIRESL